MKIYALFWKDERCTSPIKVYTRVGDLKRKFTRSKSDPNDYRIYVLDTANAVEDEDLNKWMLHHLLKLKAKGTK